MRIPVDSGNVRQNVMKLYIHLVHRLLHVLNVRCGVVQESFPLAQVGSKSHHFLLRTEAPTQETKLVKLLDPLRVVDISLAARNVLCVS